MLNRRGFLGRLTAGIAAAVVARKLPAMAEPVAITNIPNAAPVGVPLTSGLMYTPDPLYTVISSPSWCSASFNDGHLSITPSIGALSAGTYTGAVEVTSWGIPHSVPVSFTITKKAKAGRKRERGRS